MEQNDYTPIAHHVVTGFDNNYFYTEYDDYVSIYDCRQAKGDVIVPQSYNGKPVKKVLDRVFDNTEAEKKVFPEGVEEVGSIRDVEALKEIEYPSTVMKIGEIGCDNVQTIKIQEGASTGYRAYGGLRFDELSVFCESLTSIYIPSSIQAIHNISGDYVTIYTVAGSYAQQYASEEGIDCEIVEPW